MYSHPSHGFNGFNGFNGDRSGCSTAPKARTDAPSEARGAPEDSAALDAAPCAVGSGRQSEVRKEGVRGGAQGFGELLSSHVASESGQGEGKAAGSDRDQTFLRRQEEFTRLMEWNRKSLGGCHAWQSFPFCVPCAGASFEVESIGSRPSEGGRLRMLSLTSRLSTSPHSPLAPAPS